MSKPKGPKGETMAHRSMTANLRHVAPFSSMLAALVTWEGQEMWVLLCLLACEQADSFSVFPASILNMKRLCMT